MKKEKNRLSILHCQKGVALLPTILAILSLVMIVGIAISNISISENIISKNDVDSNISFAIAEAGIEDALMKIVRDKNFTSGGYGLSSSSGNATITVTGTVIKIISSLGTINNISRKIVVTADIDINGKVTQSSWAEVSP